MTGYDAWPGLPWLALAAVQRMFIGRKYSRQLILAVDDYTHLCGVWRVCIAGLANEDLSPSEILPNANQPKHHLFQGTERSCCVLVFFFSSFIRS